MSQRLTVNGQCLLILEAYFGGLSHISGELDLSSETQNQEPLEADLE